MTDLEFKVILSKYTSNANDCNSVYEQPLPGREGRIVLTTDPSGLNPQSVTPSVGSNVSDDNALARLQFDSPTQVRRPERHAPENSIQSNATNDLTGLSLDHFQVIDCIGAGGMGRVYRARDTRLSRVVALKVLDQELAKDADITRRFEQEARSAALLDDPHFARVYFCGHDRDVHYIAMEFVEGETLRDKIVRNGRLDIGLVLDVGIQVAQGLDHASHSGVVHRDIKPSNIIITPAGLAKLVDMGLARTILHAARATELTHPGVTLGTFDYISPEQARDPRDVDVRSDIYSLGCTLYHALTGRPPFPEGSGLQKLLQHQSDSVMDPRRIVPDLPAPLVGVLLRMLAKDPRDRYQSARLLVHDLAAVAELLGVPPGRRFGIYEALPAIPSFWEQHTVWAIPTILLLLAITVYSIVYRSEPIDAHLPTTVGAYDKATNRSQPTPPKAAGGRNDESVVRPTTIGKHPVAQAATEIETVTNADQLVDAIARLPSGSTIVLGADAILASPRDLSKPILGSIIDKELLIRSDSPSRLATIRVAPLVIDDPFGRRTVMLRIGGRSRLTLERVRIELAQMRGTGDRMVPLPIALDGGELMLRQCDLVIPGEVDWSVLDATMIAMASNARGLDACRLTAEATHFDSGPTADMLRVSGAGDAAVRITECAFRSTRTALRIDSLGSVTVAVDHVTAFVGSGPLFRIANLDGVLLELTNSVFSRLPSISPQPLVRVSGAGERRNASAIPWWFGSQNIYHGFEGRILELGEQRAAANLTDAKKVAGFTDATEREMALAEAEPWLWANVSRTSPVPRSSADESEAARWFQLAPSIEASWRLVHGSAPGVQISPWGKIYRPEPIVAARSPVKSNDAETKAASRSDVVSTIPNPTRLTVNPNSDDSQRVVFKDAASAALEAAAGQATVIELRTNDEMPAENILVGDGKELTVQAAQGFQPRLVLRLNRLPTSDTSRLFRIAPKAKLRVRGIAMVLDAGEPTKDATSATLFDCSEGATVEVEDVTLQIRGQVGLRSTSLFTFRAQPRPRSDLNGMPTLNMPTSPAEPLIVRVARSDIRSTAGIVAAEPSALWQLSISDCFAASTLPAVLVSGPTVPLANASQTCMLSLERSTIMLRDSLVAVDVVGQRPEEPRIIDVNTEQTAVLGLGAEPLARSAGNHRAVFQRDAVRWRGSRVFLAGFQIMYRFAGMDDGNMPASERRSWTAQDWLKQRGLSPAEFFLGPDALPASWLREPRELLVPTRENLRELKFPDDSGAAIGVNRTILPPFAQ